MALNDPPSYTPGSWYSGDRYGQFAVKQRQAPAKGRLYKANHAKSVEKMRRLELKTMMQRDELAARYRRVTEKRSLDKIMRSRYRDELHVLDDLLLDMYGILKEYYEYPDDYLGILQYDKCERTDLMPVAPNGVYHVSDGYDDTAEDQ